MFRTKLIRIRRLVFLLTLVTLECSCAASSGTQESFEQLRQTMVDQQLVSRGITDRRVLDALRKVPRQLFVPDQFRRLAYEDHPLPIGLEQTISQPYIVALMTELARRSEEHTSELQSP